MLEIKDTVTVTSNSLTNQLQPVTVTWSKSKSGTDVTDTIELFVSPVDASLAQAQLTWKNASGNGGSTDFQLPNVRQDLQFALITARSGKRELLAAGDVIRNMIPNGPTNVHLGPGTDGTWVTVQWNTANAKLPAVMWGECCLADSHHLPTAQQLAASSAALPPPHLSYFHHNHHQISH